MLTELPLKLPGRVYCSPMPFSRYDPGHSLWEAYNRANVHTVVVLVSRQETAQVTGKNLLDLYAHANLEVIYLPIPDLSVPGLDELRAGVELAYHAARSGKNIAIHCHAGLGRTGLFAACLARRALGLGPEDAVEWVRERLPGAIETPEQARLVGEYLGGSEA